MQTSPAAQRAWCAVSEADPARLDAEDVAELLASITAVRSVCDAVEVLAVRRSRELSAAGASAPPEHVLANETGRSGRDARAAATREAACGAMPAFETGLAAGRVSAGHIDAAAGVHARLDEAIAADFAAHAEDLASRASRVSVDAFERECRDLARHLTAVADRDAETAELERQRQASEVKRWVDRGTGMHKTLISLDPVRDAKMWKVINAQLGRERQQRQHGPQGRKGQNSTTPVPFSALQADAIVNTITAPGSPAAASGSVSAAASGSVLAAASDSQGSPGSQGSQGSQGSSDSQGAPGSSGSPAVPELSVLFSYEAMLNDLHTAGFVCETDDGTPLPPALVRQMACDAHIIPIILGSQGEVLDQGRKVRTATPQQRLTLAAMHSTCAFPDCTIEFSACRIHHVRWWWKHLGKTNINNLLPLCEAHHHLVHDGAWQLTLTPERIATWTRPDGTLHHHGTTINRQRPPPTRSKPPEPPDPNLTTPRDPRITAPPDPRITTPHDPRITEPPDPGATEPPDRRPRDVPLRR